jgi:hypothetical protein
MIKKNGINPDASISMTCGSCIHHTQLALYEKPCEQLGVEGYALAPRCFKPNVHTLVQNTDPEFLSSLGRTCSKLDADSVRLLAFTLNSIAQVQDHGFMFGQPVYVSLGRDYITHYFKGYVVSCTEDGMITISAKLNHAEFATTIIKHKSDVLKKSEWKLHLIKLANAGRLHIPEEHMPKYRRSLPAILKYDGSLDLDLEDVRAAIKAHESYEPPTIDMAPDDLIEQHRKLKQKDGEATGKNRKRLKPKASAYDLKERVSDNGEIAYTLHDQSANDEPAELTGE